GWEPLLEGINEARDKPGLSDFTKTRSALDRERRDEGGGGGGTKREECASRWERFSKNVIKFPLHDKDKIAAGDKPSPQKDAFSIRDGNSGERKSGLNKALSRSANSIEKLTTVTVPCQASHDDRCPSYDSVDIHATPASSGSNI
ncbi:hypothetical protein Trydic_g17512, partial [Trypoxylus dichotomus]